MSLVDETIRRIEAHEEKWGEKPIVLHVSKDGWQKLLCEHGSWMLRLEDVKDRCARFMGIPVVKMEDQEEDLVLVGSLNVEFSRMTLSFTPSK